MTGGGAGNVVSFAKEHVKRTDATFDVGMIDEDVVAFEMNNLCGIAPQTLQQGGRETFAWDAQMLKLVRFDQPTGAVVLKNQPVAPHDIVPRCVLRKIETIFD